MHSELWTSETAANYDADVADRFDPSVIDATVGFLAELVERSDSNRALEFAVGTGRVALPLAAVGVEVSGVELSEPMLDVLRSKAGSDELCLAVGDVATYRLDAQFGLVYLVFNTITNLLTQDAQVACFENAAAHLEPGGRFVIETFVPSLRRLPPGETLVPFEVTDEHIGIDEYDFVDQRLTSHHTFVRDGVVRRTSGRFRYVWPSELDLMARLAGLELEERWGDWERTPFSADSGSHVSVWRRPT